MANKSIHYVIGAVQIVSPALYKTTQTSTVFDRCDDGGIGAAFEALELMLTTGLWTDGNHSWAIQHADDDGTNGQTPGAFSTVATTDLIPSTGFTQVTSAVGQNAVARSAYIGGKRYVKVVTTETGATGLIWGLIAVPGHARNKPSIASGS